MMAQVVEPATTAQTEAAVHPIAAEPDPIAPAWSDAPVRRRSFTVDEYYRMAEAGILGPDERVELIEGEIVVMSPIGPRHAADVDRLAQRLTIRLAGKAQVRVQGPVRVNRRSEPEPDILLLRPRDDFYAGAHPQPDDVLLVVEVADSTLAYDRRVKSVLYARNGVREMWLVDIPGDAVDLHRDPSPEGYKTIRRLTRGDRIAPLAFPDLEIAVEDILG